MNGRRPIARPQIDVYVEHDGNSDLYWHRRLSDPRMFDGAWGTIDDLVQRLFVVSTAHVSPEFEAAVKSDLLAWTADEDSQVLIGEIVSKEVWEFRNA